MQEIRAYAHSKTVRRLLVSSSLAALAAGVIAPSAFAQSTSTSAESAKEPEVIVVVGIRASLTSAAGIKRNAIGVVDAISSEDLGKFPDSNVAESLQRIPGVAVDRSGGEGRFVTVRGFGPAFNTVLVNGRSFASENQGREFSFDLLASELISGAEVFKTAQARLQEGGIGGTMNIKTARPLDGRGGFRAVAVAKALYENNSKKTTPQVFGLISNSFADDTLGILAAISYQKRESVIAYTQNRGYIPNTDVGPAAAPLFKGVYAPRNQDVGIDTQDRERLGINVTGQYRPSEDLTVTIDALHNRFDVESRIQALGSWFEPSSYTAATIDSNRTVTSLTTNGNADLLDIANNRFVTTNAVGANVDWDISDTLNVNLDASWSNSKNAAGGKNYFTVIGVASRYSFAQAVGNSPPSTFGYTANLTNPGAGQAHYVERSGNNESEDVVELKADATWQLDNGIFKTARFGALANRREKDSQAIGSNGEVNCLYCGYGVAVSSNILSVVNTKGILGGQLPTAFAGYSGNRYFEVLASPQQSALRDTTLGLTPGTTAAIIARNNGYTPVVQPASFSVSEQNIAVYAEIDLEGTAGTMPWFVNAGLRYVTTEIKSSGNQLQLLDLLRVPGDNTIYNAVFANAGRPTPVSKKSNYGVFLPNLNARLTINDQLIARAAASRSITRPQIRDLAPRTSFDTNRPASLDGSGGNPDLKPYMATNLDASLEWYPTRATVLSAGVFYKKVDDFIIQLRAQEKIQIANASGLPVGGLITGPNEATYSIRRPRNSESAEITGVELNAVYNFDQLEGWVSGFGVAANATIVNTDSEFDTASTTTSFALEGLGNSYNVTVFYEKYGFSARLAWNLRERFLENLVTPGQGGDPVFRRDYNQFDLRTSYDISDTFQVFLEGTNITGNENITTGRFDNQVLDFINTGARWSLGVRASF